MDLSIIAGNAGPLAGGLFSVRIDSPGLPAPRFGG